MTRLVAYFFLKSSGELNEIIVVNDTIIHFNYNLYGLSGPRPKKAGLTPRQQRRLPTLTAASRTITTTPTFRLPAEGVTPSRSPSRRKAFGADTTSWASPPQPLLFQHRTTKKCALWRCTLSPTLDTRYRPHPVHTTHRITPPSAQWYPLRVSNKLTAKHNSQDS